MHPVAAPIVVAEPVLDGQLVAAGNITFDAARLYATTGTGTGGSGQKINAEFSGAHFTRGVVGMARGPLVNSGDSQFFIMTGSSPGLDGKYTIWGQVIEGMENVDKITKASASENGIVSRPDHIVHAYIASDKK